MPQINQRQMLPMGTVLDDRYRIVKYLASGGFGNTYIAEDTRLGGQLAIKEFFMRGTNHRSQDGTTVEVSNDENTAVFNTQLNKFRREARRIFELHNDHIIHVSDLFDANGTSYYVMDLIPGTSLAELIRQQPLTEQETRDVALQVLDALEAMHKAGLYHLDVKPGNIMRDDRGHCTLIDFGASKQLTADERATLSSSSMAYTPGYAPVEQVAQQSKDIGPWTDFYALGATLYRLVTGAPPPEVSVTDFASDGRKFPYPDTVSTSMRHAISMLMNPIHTLRPQNANAVCALLEGQNQAEETVHTTTPIFPPAPVVEDQTWHTSEPESSPRRIPLWFVLAGVAVVAALLGFLLMTKGCGGDLSQGLDSINSIGIPNDSVEKDSIQVTSPPPEEPLAPKPVEEFTVGDVTFKMIWVEGGMFTMGHTSEQTSNEDWDDSDEFPAHMVTLSDYYIGETEVTQELWKAVMGSNPSEFKGSYLPVKSVSWDDSQTFIRKLNAVTGETFRLPTEAEWEYAARGGNKSRGYQYAGSNNLSSVAWYDENSNEGTHTVGTKSPNELGIYDMSGNVCEWCQDWYDEKYYSKSSKSNPCNKTSATCRVSRGGDWFGDARYCRVAFRSCFPPVIRFGNLGLRLAR